MRTRAAWQWQLLTWSRIRGREIERERESKSEREREERERESKKEREREAAADLEIAAPRIIAVVPVFPGHGVRAHKDGLASWHNAHLREKEERVWARIARSRRDLGI